MRVAFVASFYGVEAAGGAESECRNTVARLAQSGLEVEVITTCALDLHHDWGREFHPAGTSCEDGIRVHRYPVDRLDLGPFGALNERLLNGDTLSRADQDRFISMHVCSTELLRGLAARCGNFDWICFIPYLFFTTYFGTKICPDKSIVIPCLHDEPYARMEIFAEMFGRAARIVFHTEAERRIATRLYGRSADKGVLAGEGVDLDFESDAERFRKTYGISDKFILYAGRKDRTKNVHTLVDYFAEFRKKSRNNLKLVLIGPESVPVPSNMKKEIIDLGFIPEQDKKDAYSAASLLCQPSLNESFSIVMMESWACGTPCLVHERCEVTRDHVIASGGGLYFANGAEFCGCVDHICNDPDTARKMGEAGRGYAVENYSWDRVIDRYRRDVFGPRG